jgi:hypothetical protein
VLSIVPSLEEVAAFELPVTLARFVQRYRAKQRYGGCLEASPSGLASSSESYVHRLCGRCGGLRRSGGEGAMHRGLGRHRVGRLARTTRPQSERANGWTASTRECTRPCAHCGRALPQGTTNRRAGIRADRGHARGGPLPGARPMECGSEWRPTRGHPQPPEALALRGDGHPAAGEAVVTE